MKVSRQPVVLDTNVWISAALSSPGPPARVMHHVLAHGLPAFSRHTFNELETRLWKPKFDRYISMDLRRHLLHDLKAAAVWVEVPAEIAAQSFSRDRDDDAFLHAALVAQAAWLVTGDQDLLTVLAMPELPRLTPAAAMATQAFFAI